jgi:AcrR family transcriptional regulator
MSIKERRRKEKEELRQQILDVAKDIAAADGWQNVTIRKICNKIHYTAPVIYHYFESKEMILESLRQEGIKQVYFIFEALDKKHSAPDKRLLEYGLAWWNFSKLNPELYQVMYNLQGVVCNNNTNTQNSVVTFYYSAFSQISIKAKRSEKLRLELCDHFIAIIHGFIALRMVNKIKSGKDKAELVYKNALLRFIHSIKDINTVK